MTQIECEFEAEALSAALQSRWPDRVESELRAHVAGCSICSDVIAIAGAMDEAREDVRASAVVPDSGVVWWRAQLRARREAAEAAGRPITAAQAVAFACVVGVLGALIGATSTSLQKWLQAWPQSVIANLNVSALMHSMATAASEHQAIVLAIVGIICVVPTAVYLVLRND